MELPAACLFFFDPDSIEVWAYAGNEVGRSGALTVGDSWRVGAIDREAFQYEVLIVVVNRRKDNGT